MTGKAAVVVSGLQATKNNYNSIVDMLKEQFSKQDILVQGNLTQLPSLPQVKVLESESWTSESWIVKSTSRSKRIYIAALKTLAVDLYG